MFTMNMSYYVFSKVRPTGQLANVQSGLEIYDQINETTMESFVPKGHFYPHVLYSYILQNGSIYSLLAEHNHCTFFFGIFGNWISSHFILKITLAKKREKTKYKSMHDGCMHMQIAICEVILGNNKRNINGHC